MQFKFSATGDSIVNKKTPVKPIQHENYVEWKFALKQTFIQNIFSPLFSKGSRFDSHRALNLNLHFLRNRGTEHCFSGIFTYSGILSLVPRSRGIYKVI